MPKKADFSARPSCPECGAKRTWDNGPRWQCSICGKQWGKVKYTRVKKEFRDRPQCPTCGAYRSSPHTLDNNWRCLSCGKAFTVLPEEF